MITVKLTCKKHPRYKAKRSPRCECGGCAWLYFMSTAGASNGSVKVKRIDGEVK